MKTFKEASEELKITKQTLTSWIKELNESNNIIWKNKTRYLDETLLNKIKKYKNVENNDNLFSENKSKNFDEKENLKSELKIALDHYEYNGEIKNYSEVEKINKKIVHNRNVQTFKILIPREKDSGKNYLERNKVFYFQNCLESHNEFKIYYFKTE